MYNLSLVNATGMLSLAQTVNDNLMQGYLGSLFLVTVFFIVFLSFINRNVEAKSAIAYSLTIIAVLSLPFRVLDLITDVTVWSIWIMFALSMMMIFFTD